MQLFRRSQLISPEPHTDDTVVAVAEQGAGRPNALLKWFYPGRETGNEFLLSQAEGEGTSSRPAGDNRSQPTDSIELWCYRSWQLT